MKKRLLILILVSLLCYLAGGYLQNIYGLDPPYIFYWSGFVLRILAILLVLTTLIVYGISFVKNRK
ncbi:hypothetical protein ATE49_08745 [Elizabethkingia miricola]|uniref:DUF3955 domain-containing protein n=1 Tax=Elizabethkingia miricola TaxID=172045 RepID=A0ABY3NKA1_ELIMR|nr:hypothetical protein [Elizabethkingia sp. ASV34]ATL44371.1 hypothetical protein CQS02_14215 [Elizabethkingia miricola]OPC24342.1 hypothetical protein BAY00_04165 [Elizabethkingia bruuniana]OBS11726.1 hypothetical protein ATE49_08745 [Elizabethkingia miricola]OPC52365.1 hypothetical protein BAY07_12135 [Elizabethkingia bruuniana]OPC60485.1 hypothetical protein BAY13_08850 [Elizabethkingia bruuniana]